MKKLSLDQMQALHRAGSAYRKGSQSDPVLDRALSKLEDGIKYEVITRRVKKPTRIEQEQRP